MKGFDIMAFMYDIVFYSAYFLIMIVFLTIAIILGNRPAGWSMYGIGAFIQFLSLVGLYNSYQGYPYFGYGYEEAFAPYKIIYAFLLIVSAIFVALHKPKSPKSTETNISIQKEEASECSSVDLVDKIEKESGNTKKNTDKDNIRDSLYFFLAIIILPVIIIGIIGLIKLITLVLNLLF